jgi:hypothetical protein
MGFTSAQHLTGTALLASWKQVGPSILKTTQMHSMHTLLQSAPDVDKLLKEACAAVDPTIMNEFYNMQPTSAALDLLRRQILGHPLDLGAGAALPRLG